jgi:hypothetical protein
MQAPGSAQSLVVGHAPRESQRTSDITSLVSIRLRKSRRTGEEPIAERFVCHHYPTKLQLTGMRLVWKPCERAKRASLSLVSGDASLSMWLAKVLTSW